MNRATWFLPFYLLFFSAVTISAQTLEHKPRKSPTGLVNFKDGDQYLKITYGRPKLISDRQFPFGESREIARHQWGKIWRTGDDDATEFTFTQPLKFAGKSVDPGTYSLFTIPDSTEWTVMLNNEVGLWGTYKYNPEKDVVREKVKVYKSPYVYEEFSIFLMKQDYGADIIMIWGRVAVAIPLEYARKGD